MSATNPINTDPISDIWYWYLIPIYRVSDIGMFHSTSICVYFYIKTLSAIQYSKSRNDSVYADFSDYSEYCPFDIFWTEILLTNQKLRHNFRRQNFKSMFNNFYTFILAPQAFLCSTIFVELKASLLDFLVYSYFYKWALITGFATNSGLARHFIEHFSWSCHMKSVKRDKCQFYSDEIVAANSGLRLLFSFTSSWACALSSWLQRGWHVPFSLLKPSSSVPHVRSLKSLNRRKLSISLEYFDCNMPASRLSVVIIALTDR